jgi:hypothetical protein
MDSGNGSRFRELMIMHASHLANALARCGMSLRGRVQMKRFGCDDRE